MAFNLTIHMVSSLDGIIAKKDNSVSWFETTSPYEQGVDAEHAAGDEPAIDCFVMGSKTFELAVTLSAEYGWPYGDIPVVVLSRRKLPVERDNVKIYPGDLQTLVSEHLAPRYKNVWLVGGAEVAADFIRQKLANDIRLTIIPIVLGEGKPFLSGEGLEQALQLKKVTAHKTGLVELWYTL